MSSKLIAGNATNGSSLSADTTGILEIQTGSTPTTAITVDASQNVGIGTSSPAYKLDVAGTMRGRGDAYLGFVNGSQAGVWWSQSNYAVPAFQGLTSAGNVGDIVMQLGGGNLLVGGTANPNSGKIASNVANSARFMSFVNNSNSAEIGSIQNNSGTSVLYNVTSDYRLKSNVSLIEDAIQTISKLNPVTYTWIQSNTNDAGFLAHEFQSVIPNYVVGEKDAVNEHGNPIYQQMDSSGVIPFLVKAIQELNAKVTALETQLGAK